jgi:hypothetical protein
MKQPLWSISRIHNKISVEFRKIASENCNEVFQNQIFNHCLIGIWNPITGPNRHGWLDDGFPDS